jgi:hypothetical protein
LIIVELFLFTTNLNNLKNLILNLFKDTLVSKKLGFLKPNFSKPGGVATVAHVCGTTHAGGGL